MVELLAKVGSYAVGDVWALVPPRKAVWSLPGKSKATGKTFFLLLFLCFIPVLFFLFFFSFYFISCVLLYISSVCLYSLSFHLLCVTTRSQTVE